MRLDKQLENEAAIIGKAIGYLRDERDSIRDSYTNPNTGTVQDKEGLQWLAEIQELIDGLAEGTVAGRAYTLAQEMTNPNVDPELVAEAWKEFCDEHSISEHI